ALISPEGFGFGDVKLGGLLGLYLGWLGWDFVILGVVAGFLIGTVIALVLMALRRASLRTPVPFGPALLAGALAAVVAGPQLLTAYGG
ncbi:MAG: prepilin peptidase, partial [Actinomycetota bacterium]|nr:prepilin peptidase [Actinomycetota bacterium]